MSFLVELKVQQHLSSRFSCQNVIIIVQRKVNEPIFFIYKCHKNIHGGQPRKKKKGKWISMAQTWV